LVKKIHSIRVRKLTIHLQDYHIKLFLSLSPFVSYFVKLLNMDANSNLDFEKWTFNGANQIKIKLDQRKQIFFFHPFVTLNKFWKKFKNEKKRNFVTFSMV